MKDNVSDWQTWRDLFQSRADRLLPPLDADLDYTQLPRSLARSLAVFQLGEPGGGTVIEQAQRSQLSTIDDNYVEALDLFVAEEHRHANLLAICVRMMGGELIRKNWTAKLFVFGRRLIGLRFKILVLLAAEVIGLCFYRLIATRLPPCRMRDTLLQLVADEHSHLQFHCAFLKGQVATPFQRAIFKWVWRTMMFCAGLVVLIDHRRTLRDMSIDTRDFRELWSHYRLAAEIHVLGMPNMRPVDRLRRGSRAPDKSPGPVSVAAPDLT